MAHRKEQSFGIIPVRKRRGVWEVLLVQHGHGHWAFPKGHPEKGEEAIETAAREFSEETGMTIKTLLDIPPQQEHYFFRHGVDLIEKKVLYFVAEVKGKIKLQEREISDYKWLSIEEARELATFSQAKAICSNIADYLR